MAVLTDPFLLAKSQLYGYILRTRGKISIITILKAQKWLNRDQYIQENFENRGKMNQRWKIQNIGSLVNFKIFIIRKLSFLIAQQHLKPSQYSFHIPMQSSKTFASPDFYRSPSFLSYSPSSSPLTICFFGSQNPFSCSPYSSLTVILMSTSKRYDLSIDLTTNPIYYAISYNNSMGKSLRTREVLTDTDHDNEEDNTALPISHSVGSGFLRKISKSKLAGKKESSTRINNFKKRVQTNQIADIMNQQRFECPICLELLINPVMMSCGHVYCYRCLQSNAAYSERCCLCRSEQRGDPHVSLTIIEKLIEHFVLPSSDELIRYLCRTTDSLEWSKRRRINNWKQGLVVDFQDRCHVWRRGVIVSTSPTQVQIKINIKGIDLFEKVENNSRRLAPYTFFTRGRYLEDFPTTLPEHDTTQRQLMKLEYKPSWVEENAFQFRELELLESEPMDHPVSEEDEALRLFNFQMNELDSILNL